MSGIPPVPFRWNGEAMVPLSRWAKPCDRYFTIGQTCVLVEHQPRSTVSHNHYFACIHEIWLNIPESMVEKFPTSEHLRKFALIKCHYADHIEFVASSKTEAIRIAAFLRPVDEYAILTVRDYVVTRWTAKSQSIKAMGAKEFQRSKTDVLEYLAALVKVPVETIELHAGMSA